MSWEKVRKMHEMGDQARRLHMEWLRMLVQMAAAALALLVSLKPAAAVAAPQCYLLAGCWVCLALGLLCGGLAMHGEARLAKIILGLYRDTLAAELDGGLAPITLKAKLPWPYRCAEIGLAVFLPLAVVCLVGFAVLEIL
jgi:hypothetical protein